MNLPKLQKIDPNKPNKKKILLLSDDIRLFSGIATQGKEMVFSTVDKYDWVQIAGSIQHPDKGKIIDMSQAVAEATGVSDASVKLYPTDGYGNPDMLRELIAREKPDAILHFTDPRFWGWLYQMEHELRQEIPLLYLNIWDDLGYLEDDKIVDPNWNEPFYRSCDMLMSISKQTYGINKRLLPEYTDWQLKYVPHGMNTNVFYPIHEAQSEYKQLQEYKKQIFGDFEPEFVVMTSNRNIRRKNISDVIAAYKLFCNKLPKEKADKCVLYLHTQAIDNNGTDLLSVIENICPEYKIYISAGHCDSKSLNYLYNLADVTVNIASNEGFGLTTCEGLATGTPTIVNVTGGLQDQCGFKIANQLLAEQDYVELGSLHDIDTWKNNHTLSWGKWVYPVWSRTRSIKGSVPTPYIYDDTVAYIDVVPGLLHFYNMTPEERVLCGKAGTEYIRSKESGMSDKYLRERYIDAFEGVFTNWKPRKRFELCSTEMNVPVPKIRMVNPQIREEQPQQAELKLPKLKKINV